LLLKFSCVVTRGISDYVDSHKNDMTSGMHRYAAATATSTAKELPSYLRPETAANGLIRTDIPQPIASIQPSFQSMDFFSELRATGASSYIG
jgi:hypothetical protein